MANTTLTDVPLSKNAFIHELFAPELKENMRDALLMTRITNSEFQGKFRNKGDTIVVRKTPLIHSKLYVDDQKIAAESPEADDEKHIIGRARYWAFRYPDIAQALTDVPNLAGTLAKEGALSLAQDIEEEFFGDIYAKCDTYNKGNAAGRISGSYVLGNSTATDGSGNGPLYLYKTQALADADTTSNRKKAAVVDAIAAAAGCLGEQKGGKQGRPFIVIPEAVAVRIQTSELKDASLAGDTKSIIRLGVESIGSIAGMDIYRSNLLPKVTVDGRTCFVCLFGDTTAITFANEISKTEMYRDPETFADVHRSLCVYDWFVRWAERFGHMVVTLG